MYRRIGIDPTKTRPSSEALLRRVRKGDHLPRINTLVDLCNWCSFELQLPYGLYDRAPHRAATRTAAGTRRRGVQRHPQGRRARRGPDDARRCPRAVRQSDVGLGADDGDRRDARRARASSSRRPAWARRCCPERSTSPAARFVEFGARRSHRPRRHIISIASSSHARCCHRRRRRPGNTPRHDRSQAVPRAGWTDGARSHRWTRWPVARRSA